MLPPPPRTRIPPSDSDLDSDSDVIFLGSCPLENRLEILSSDSESKTYESPPPKRPSNCRNKRPCSSPVSRHFSGSELDVIIAKGDSGSDADDEDPGGLSVLSTIGFSKKRIPFFRSCLPLSDTRSSIWRGRESGVGEVLRIAPKETCRRSLGEVPTQSLNALVGKGRNVVNASKRCQSTTACFGKPQSPTSTMSSFLQVTPFAYTPSSDTSTSTASSQKSGTNTNRLQASGNGQVQDTSMEGSLNENVGQPSSDYAYVDHADSEAPQVGPPTKKQKVAPPTTTKSKVTVKKPPKPRKRRALESAKGATVPPANNDEDAIDQEQEAIIAGEIDTTDDDPKKPVIYKDSYRSRDGINRKVAPINNVHKMFEDLTKRALVLGFDHVLKSLDNRPLKVGTMCSGTEAPLIAVGLVNEYLRNANLDYLVHIEHAFSAEIVPIKQHFIQRNFNPPYIFRDITELSKPLDEDGKRRATTAHGGKAEVPGSLDLLVAGFSCVDFSPMNSKQKSLADCGESGDTFFAMLDYAKESRPKCVILENVLGAPWLKPKQKDTISIGSHFEKIGYSCVFLKADTKDYYLPHTRQRGYMICVDNEIPGMATQASGLLAQSKSVFEQLKAQASVPVEAMLLPHDDPLLRASANEFNPATGKKIDWHKCRVGHEDYRRQLGLGKKRELTHWSADGPLRNHDYFIAFPGQKERVSDTIEIAHLRNLKRGFDDRYYSRNLETSQNVYRVTDVTKNGIIGCLTPTGMPWNTLRGGKIIGLEAMILQGMPVESLDFSGLSQSQLQNLAGNAMSTTVIGAAILAALTGFRGLFDPEHRKKRAEKIINPHLAGEQDLLPEKISDPAIHKSTTFKELKDSASLAISLCLCEGRHDLHETKFQKCTVCGHTTCQYHGRNPKHFYEPIVFPAPKDRQNPDNFKNELKASLPMKLSFNVDGKNTLIQKILAEYREELDLADHDQKVVVDAIEAALKSQLIFRHATRSDIWEVVFESPASKALLTISSKSSRWLLFAKCPADLPGSHAARLFLEKQPIARMIPEQDSNSVITGSWSYWCPDVREFPATITSKGKLEESFLSGRGLTAENGSSVYTRCSIEIEDYSEEYFDSVDIRGDYELSQPCGQAFNSLHRKLPNGDQPKDDPPIFLYFEHQKPIEEEADKSSYIFTRCNRRLQYGGYRDVIASVGASWHEKIPPKASFPQERKTITEIAIDGYWKKLSLGKNLALSPAEGHNVVYRHLPEDVSALKFTECGSQQAIFTCKHDLEEHNAAFPTNKWIELIQANKAKFFESLGWVVEKCKVIPGHLLDGLIDVDAWHPTHSKISFRCTKCAPKEPSRNWGFPKKFKNKTTQKNLEQVAFEEPEQATHFERNLKLRPYAISTFFRINHDQRLEIKIGFDPLTLCHRAAALLRPATSLEGIQTSWWLATDDTKSSKELLQPFKLQNTSKQRSALRPPGLTTKYNLFPNQLRKLSWMESQEDGVSFTEREVVESKVQELGFLLMGQASQERLIRGGILADEVGFGKTILILGLILSRFQLDKKTAQTPVEGKIPTQASIIFVPDHLPKQWRAEAQKFLGNHPAHGSILVIEHTKDLEKLTVKDIKEALVIIVSLKSCQDDKYQLALADFSGMVETNPKANPMAKAAWYASAQARIAKNVEQLKEHPGTFADHLHTQFIQSVEDAKSKIMPVPSKRLRGAAYAQLSMTKRKFDDFEENEHAKWETLAPRQNDPHKLFGLKSGEYDRLLFPVFEMFKFARVVVDEFTYIQTNQHLTTMNVAANAYWALSGTPPLDSFSNIKHMAEFLRVNLGVHDFVNMERDDYTKMTNDMTTSERLLTFQSKPSQAWLKLRHVQAEKFLIACVRKDVPVFDLPDYFSTLKLIDQTPLETAVYAELEQRVAAREFELKASKSKFDMEKYIDEALAKSDRGRIALLFRASYMSVLELGGQAAVSAAQALSVVLTARQAQFNNLFKEWARQMGIAVWGHRHPANQGSFALHYYLSTLFENAHGDKDIIDLCSRRAEEALTSPRQLMTVAKSLTPFQILKTATRELGNLMHQLVDLKRSIRFLDSIRCAGQGHNKCHKCGNVLDAARDSVILSKCGHTLCTSQCCQAWEEDCPVEGCESYYEAHHMIPGRQFAKRQPKYFAAGSKFCEIIKLIKEVNKEQVLLFAQSPELRQKIRKTFDSQGIKYQEIESAGNMSARLTKFQKKSTWQVLILDIGDASAAGSNLTMATHVIFAAPYLTMGPDAQRTYDAARTQAIGRAHRFGQEENVHVWDFVTKHTIDVDIIEKRSGGMILEEYKMPGSITARLVKPEDGQQSQFGSRLRHKIFPAEWNDY